MTGREAGAVRTDEYRVARLLQHSLESATHALAQISGRLFDELCAVAVGAASEKIIIRGYAVQFEGAELACSRYRKSALDEPCMQRGGAFCAK